MKVAKTAGKGGGAASLFASMPKPKNDDLGGGSLGGGGGSKVRPELLPASMHRTSARPVQSTAIARALHKAQLRAACRPLSPASCLRLHALIPLSFTGSLLNDHTTPSPSTDRSRGQQAEARCGGSCQEPLR